jgi:hypothetical protein
LRREHDAAGWILPDALAAVQAGRALPLEQNHDLAILSGHEVRSRILEDEAAPGLGALAT